MIIEDITYSNNKLTTDVECGIVMKETIPVQLQTLTYIKLFLESYDTNEWLVEASNRVLVNVYVKEAREEVERARRFRDKVFKKETKREVWKEIFKNPIKSLWLLKYR